MPNLKELITNHADEALGKTRNKLLTWILTGNETSSILSGFDEIPMGFTVVILSMIYLLYVSMVLNANLIFKLNIFSIS